MSKQLINALLRIVQSPDDFPTGSGKALSAFCKEYKNIGVQKGNQWMFTDAHRKDIKHFLKGRFGVDADTVQAGSWDGLSRSDSLKMAYNEKLNRRSVGKGRLRMKTLKNSRLAVMGCDWLLPHRSDMGADVDAVLSAKIQHDGLLIVENLQTFDDIFDVDDQVMSRLCLANPLILYRGDTQGGARTDAVNTLISSTDLPVVAFFDYDPSGLSMALHLPRLDSILAPATDILESSIAEHGIIDRYQQQVASIPHDIEKLRHDHRTSELWHIIYASGKALPQEYFHSHRI